MSEKVIANSNAGMRVLCDRCAKPCKVAQDRKADARLAVEANGAGLCKECIATAIFKNIVEGDAYAAGSFAAFTAEGLRLPHIQKQFEAVLASGGSRMPATEIDWDEVIANWALPVPKRHKDQGLFS